MYCDSWLVTDSRDWLDPHRTVGKISNLHDVVWEDTDGIFIGPQVPVGRLMKSIFLNLNFGWLHMGEILWKQFKDSLDMNTFPQIDQEK